MSELKVTLHDGGSNDQSDHYLSIQLDNSPPGSAHIAMRGNSCEETERWVTRQTLLNIAKICIEAARQIQDA